MKINAYAKLNLSLDIIGKRKDGYHNLDTIMQSISLCDTVTISRADGLSVTMDTGDVADEENTATVAAKAFFSYTDIFGAHINIEKRIPERAGLGGSSADAAAVLIGLDRLYGTKLGLVPLMMLGKYVGADVPFAVFGGTARAKGIGDKLTRLRPKTPGAYVVVTPHTGVSTPEAFARYKPAQALRMETIVYAIQKGDLALYHRHAGNALALSALGLAPGIMAAANALTAAGAQKALLTGSGSSMFAAFETRDQAQAVADKIEGDFALTGVFEPMETGTTIIEESE